MSEKETEEKEKEAKPVRVAAIPVEERREAKRKEVRLKMSEGCRCPMWAPEKAEEWEKWIKERAKRMREMGCMCPMWESEEEKAEKK